MASLPPRAARVATAVVFFVNGVGFGLWAAHIPILQAGFGLDAATLGVALLVLALGAVIAMPLTGPLTAAVGSRPCTVVSGAIYGIGLGFPLLAPNLWVLLPSVLLLGAANGTMDVAMNTQASSVERAYLRPLMSAFHAFFSLGGVAGSLLAAGLLAAGTPPRAHMAVLGLTITAAVIVAGRWMLPGHDGGSAGLSLPSGAALGVGGLTLLTMLAEGAVMDWSAVYLATVTGAATATAALGYAAFSTTMTLGRLTGDRIVGGLGRGTTLAASGTIAAVGLLLTLASGTVGPGIVGFGVAGIGLANIVPLLFSAGARLPDVAPGVGVAMVATLGYAGFLLGPPVIGTIADAMGLRVALLLIVPGVITVAILGRRVLSRTVPIPGDRR
jgi:MFS family permease